MRQVHKFSIMIELPADPDYPERDSRAQRKEQIRQLADKHWPGARVLYIETVREES